MSRYEVPLLVINYLGMHARACQKITRHMMDHANTTIELCSSEERVSAKSILGLLTLGCGPGREVMACVEGPGSEEALIDLCDLFEAGFGEWRSGLDWKGKQVDASLRDLDRFLDKYGPENYCDFLSYISGLGSGPQFEAWRDRFLTIEVRNLIKSHFSNPGARGVAAALLTKHRPGDPSAIFHAYKENPFFWTWLLNNSRIDGEMLEIMRQMEVGTFFLFDVLCKLSHSNKGALSNIEGTYLDDPEKALRKIAYSFHHLLHFNTIFFTVDQIARAKDEHAKFIIAKSLYNSYDKNPERTTDLLMALLVDTSDLVRWGVCRSALRIAEKGELISQLGHELAQDSSPLVQIQLKRGIGRVE